MRDSHAFPYWPPAQAAILRTPLVLLAFLSGAYAEPRTIAVPPAPPVEYFDDNSRIEVCLSLYLHERFREIDEVRPVSEGWARALYYELKGGKRRLREGELFQAFSSYLTVDAVIDSSMEDGNLAFVLHTADGIRRLEIAYPDQVNAMEAVHAAARFLAQELRLSAASTERLCAKRIANKDLFDAYYLSQRILAEYKTSPAETRLRALQPFLDGHQRSLPLAARILECATGLTTSRYQGFAGTGLQMVRAVLPRVLGTDLESTAYPVLSQSPEFFEKDLVAMVEPLTGDELDMVLVESGPGGAADDPLAIEPRGAGASAGAGGAALTIRQRIGALRCLGALSTAKALETLGQTAESTDARVRGATAFALLHHRDQAGQNLQDQLARDDEPTVAFWACLGLWRRAKRPPRLLSLARQVLEQKGSRREAAEVIERLGTHEDVPRLTALSLDGSPAVRASAARGLLRLGAADTQRLLSFLNEPAEAVVLAALPGLPKSVEKPVLNRVVQLANHPYTPVPQAARLALARFRPAEPRARVRFDLASAHTYVRLQTVDSLAASREPWALAELGVACGNPDPHTRAHALGMLLTRDPAQAGEVLAGAVLDPYSWVRLHAAVMLSSAAEKGHVPSIRKALVMERDDAVRLYLADALARAEDRPPPDPRPPVHPVSGAKNLTWSWGSSIEKSPVQAYYHGRSSPGMTEEAKRASKAGKIYFGRINTTVRNPGLIITDPEWRDRFWLAIDEELNATNLPWIDGLVFGEETMSASPDALWPTGWPLFCRDAGLDPARVKGNRDNLSVYEARAWTHWGRTKVVEGFNVLYDYVKLKYGKLRPGIQCCTFLPSIRYTATRTDTRWKFDVAGAYRYGGSNRDMYTQIRWLKTLWPDRPVLWLSNGNVGVGLNSGVKYDYQAPAEPLDARSYRAYADSISAWLAGADTGWFNGWSFIRGDTKPRATDVGKCKVRFQDFSADSPLLDIAIDYAFKGVEAARRAEPVDAPSEAGDATAEAATEEEEPEDELEPDETKEAEGEDDEIAGQVRREKQRMRTGFFLLQKYLYDCTRVFSSLPRSNARPAALVIHPWPRGRTFDFPALRLLNAYDYLCDINMAPQIDLSRYRVIAISSLDDAPLTDETIGALTAWLEDHPGLLSVHGTLSADNTNEASTTQDHDGKLRRDWPWEKDITLPGESFRIAGDRAKVLATGTGGPNLVLWRHPELKGAVLFDTGPRASGELRQMVNALHKEHAIGFELNGPEALQAQQEGSLVAAASGGSSGDHSLQGVDLLTGEANPAVGPGLSGAIVARNWRGTFIASFNGVSVLCDKPIDDVQPVPGGLRIRCSGLTRAGSQTGDVEVTPDGGQALPVIEADAAAEWILFGDEEGLASLVIRDTDSRATYIRSRKTLTIRQRERRGAK